MTNKFWIKLYIEILDDPKMGRLENHLWCRAVECFLLAGEQGDDGALRPVEETAWRLRLSEDRLALISVFPHTEFLGCRSSKIFVEKLTGLPRPWTARFQATVAIATPSGKVEMATWKCEGEIIPEERGTNGFGYDLIFLVSGLGRTMAELDLDKKNKISHQANAIRNAIPPSILY